MPGHPAKIESYAGHFSPGDYVALGVHGFRIVV